MHTHNAHTHTHSGTHSCTPTPTHSRLSQIARHYHHWHHDMTCCCCCFCCWCRCCCCLTTVSEQQREREREGEQAQVDEQCPRTACVQTPWHLALWLTSWTDWMHHHCPVSTFHCAVPGQAWAPLKWVRRRWSEARPFPGKCHLSIGPMPESHCGCYLNYAKQNSSCRNEHRAETESETETGTGKGPSPEQQQQQQQLVADRGGPC